MKLVTVCDGPAEYVVLEAVVAPAAPAGVSVWADDVGEVSAEDWGDEGALLLTLAGCSRLRAVWSAVGTSNVLSRIFMVAAMITLFVSLSCSKIANNA